MGRSDQQAVRADEHGRREKAREVTEIEAIAHLEQSLRDKDDIIQAQYAELASTRHRLDQAVEMLNEMRAELNRRKVA